MSLIVWRAKIMEKIGDGVAVLVRDDGAAR